MKIKYKVSKLDKILLSKCHREEAEGLGLVLLS